MTRDALLAARLLATFLMSALGLSFVLVLLGADAGASVGDVLHATVFTAGAAFGAHGSIGVGPARLLVTASPLLVSVLTVMVAYASIRRAALRPEWIGVAAIAGWLITFGLVGAANGWDHVTMNAPVAASLMALTMAATGALAWAGQRWSVLVRPVALVLLAVLVVVTVGLLTELIAGLSYDGPSGHGLPLHTEIALALAYAPNVGLAALGLGLGGGLAVTGNVTEYATFVSRFAGDGPTAAFGTPHGQGPWADVLHLPGLACVYVLAPVAVMAVAVSARWLRDRGELITWAVSLTALVVGLGAVASFRLAAHIDSFELDAALDPTGWGRLAGLAALPLGLAVFVLTRSAVEPGLDVGDRPRELSREVS